MKLCGNLVLNLTDIDGNGMMSLVLQIVSPILTSDNPVTAQMSPAITSSTGIREKLLKTKTSVSFPVFTFSYSAVLMLVSKLDFLASELRMELWDCQLQSIECYMK